MKTNSRIVIIIFFLFLSVSLMYSRTVSASTAQFKEYYKPIAEWTGLLIMPDKSKRESDGSVWIQVRNSPRKDLVGKIVRLRWENTPWYDKYRPDVNISQDTLEKEKKKGLTLPHRLNGLKRVSALESLAGARKRDVTEVLLKNPEFKNNSLYIENAPVQIVGNQHTLVKFIGIADGEMRKVIHYNRASSRFDPRTVETVNVPVTNTYPNSPEIVTSTLGIEKSELNDYGWYAYGRRIDGVFCIQALAPRKIFMIQQDMKFAGKRDIKHYFGKVHHRNLFNGMNRRTSLTPSRASENPWKPGTKGFVVHLFGNSLRPGEKKPKIVTGHLSFGIAEVIKDPFTGQSRFTIEYKQVYAHTAIGIVSGSSMWHCFMGDLRRGWMYALPVTDTIIHIPEMGPYNINGWVISPYDGLETELERMMAIYRTGAGSGCSDVRPDVSCVQDSNSALYSALENFIEKVKNNPKAKHWLNSKNTSISEIKRFEKLVALVKKVKDKLTLLGLLQSNWKNFLRNPLGSRKAGKVKRIIDAILSIGTVFPRRSNDTLLKLAADRHYFMWSIYTANIGGIIEGLRPLGAQSVLLRK